VGACQQAGPGAQTSHAGDGGLSQQDSTYSLGSDVERPSLKSSGDKGDVSRRATRGRRRTISGRRTVWRNSRRDGARKTSHYHGAFKSAEVFGSAPRTPIQASCQPLRHRRAGQMAASDQAQHMPKLPLVLRGASTDGARHDLHAANLPSWINGGKKATT
jgi:hypothetical protein